jgi:hypothetical protein
VHIRDRIVELKRVPARDLRPHPKNWRTHPKAQQEALRGILAEVGYADALLARDTPEGLQLIDGHLRAETTPEQEVPVLVLDVTEEEADKLLATIDPLAGLAVPDEEKLGELLAEITTDNDALQALFDDLSPMKTKEGLTDPDDVPEPPDSGKDWSDRYHEVEIRDAEQFFSAVFGNAIEVTEPNAAWYCWHAHRRGPPQRLRQGLVRSLPRGRDPRCRGVLHDRLPQLARGD